MKDDRVLLLHVRDAISRIASYTAGGRADFQTDTRTQDAVLRNIEVIGEAVKRLSASARAKQPTIPWKSIGAMRDKVIHQYFSVDLDLVWEVVARDLPALRTAVEALLSGYGP